MLFMLIVQHVACDFYDTTHQRCAPAGTARMAFARISMHPRMCRSILSQNCDQNATCLRQAVQTATASAQHANAVAQDVASSKSAKEAGTKLWVLWRSFDSSNHFASFARALVGYLNHALMGMATLHERLLRC